MLGPWSASARAAGNGAVPAPVAVEKWEKRPVRLPPLFWYEKDPELQRRLLMLGLLYWDFQERETAHKLLLPVFYRWREEDRRLLVSLPLVVSYRRPDERWMLAGLFFRHADQELARTAVFPLYWQKIRREGGRVTLLPPFLFYDYRSHDRSKLDQVSLAGWRRRRGEKSAGILLNYWWNRDAESRFRVFFPLYWHAASPVDRWDVLGLFYLRREWAAPEPSATRPLSPPVSPFDPFHSLGTIPPLGGGAPGQGPPKRRAADVRAGLFPLVGAGWGEDLRSHHLFPLYYYSRTEDQRAWITLLFSRFRRDDQRAGHVGLYFYSHDPDLRVDGIFPLWSRRQSSDGFESKTQVLNFYHRLENEERFHTLFPLYGYWSTPEESRFLSWGLWGRKSADSAAGWAWLYHWRREKEDTTRIFFPLYWHFWRAPDWGVDVLFPLYTRYRDGDTTVTAVPPVVWRKTGDRRTWSFLFLYWRDQDRDRGSTTFLPLFHDTYDPGRRMFFSPLAWTRRSASSREGIVPPVYWYRSAEARRTIVFPLYWGASAPDKGLTILPPYYRFRRDDLRAHGIFPLWGRHHDKEDRGGYLFPFYWYSADGKGDGLWIIPPMLGYVSKRGSDTENPQLTVQYLILGNVYKSTNTLSHDFFPLYKYIRQDDFRNFWAPRGLALMAWEREGPHRKGYFFPYAYRRSPAKDWDLFVPLFYKSRTFALEGSTDTVQTRGERTGGLTTVFPLYWSGRNPQRAYRFFFPLYGRYEEGARRVNVFAPLWTSYNSPTGRKFRLFFPLYWRFLLKSQPTAEAAAPETAPAAVPAPEKEKAVSERDIVVVGPWYRVDTRTPDRQSRTLGLAPFFSRTVAGPKDRYFEVLGGLFARDVQEGLRRFRFLYFFYTKPKAL